MDEKSLRDKAHGVRNYRPVERGGDERLGRPWILYVVGAGPGDPRLLTLRAQKFLARADLVAYDDLLHPKILAWTKNSCVLLPVGYRGQIHTEHPRRSGEGQSSVHPLVHPEVVAAVQKGLRVVRLKCGDPMIFGRSAEEEEELLKHGIRCRYVPGITAALGVASQLAMPLTDRRYSSQVVFRAGSARASEKQTIVLYMPRKTLEHESRRLMSQGWDPETPVVFVSAATTMATQVARATLGDLRPLATSLEGHLPGLVVVGATAGMGAGGWGHDPVEGGDPLKGMRVLLLRHALAPSRLAAMLRIHGADVVEFPLMGARTLGEGGSEGSGEGMLPGFDGFPPWKVQEWDMLYLRTVDDACHFFKSLVFRGMDIRSLPQSLRMYGKGSRVLNHLRQQGLQVWDEEKLMADVGQGSGLYKVAVPCGLGEAPGVLHQRGMLFSKGKAPCQVIEVPCYDIVGRGFRVTAPRPHVIVVPHGKAWKQFKDHAGPGQEGVLGFSWRDCPWVAFGPLLKEAVESDGVSTCHEVRTLLESQKVIKDIWFSLRGDDLISSRSKGQASPMGSLRPVVDLHHEIR